METKTCRMCGETKPASAYSRQSGGRSHLQPYCKPCVAQRVRERRKARQMTPEMVEAAREAERLRKAAYRARYPEKARAQMRKASRLRQRTVPDLLWRAAKKRAKDARIPFSITRADVVVPDACPALGIPLERGGGYEARDNSPTIDRIIPSLGYVPGNVAVISFRANRIKSDATLAELRALVAFLGCEAEG